MPGETSGADEPRASLSDEIKESAEAFVDEQRARAAETVRSVADTLRDTADTLERKRIGALADYAERAAEEVERWSDTVRDKDLALLLDQANDAIRRHPGLTLAGAAGVGFLLGRLLKSSEAA